MYLKETGGGVVNWIYLAQYRYQHGNEASDSTKGRKLLD
jgi:hypothetical protein